MNVRLIAKSIDYVKDHRLLTFIVCVMQYFYDLKGTLFYYHFIELNLGCKIKWLGDQCQSSRTDFIHWHHHCSRICICEKVMVIHEMNNWFTKLNIQGSLHFRHTAIFSSADKGKYFLHIYVWKFPLLSIASVYNEPCHLKYRLWGQLWLSFADNPQDCKMPELRKGFWSFIIPIFSCTLVLWWANVSFCLCFQNCMETSAIWPIEITPTPKWTFSKDKFDKFLLPLTHDTIQTIEQYREWNEHYCTQYHTYIWTVLLLYHALQLSNYTFKRLYKCEMYCWYMRLYSYLGNLNLLYSPFIFVLP